MKYQAKWNGSVIAESEDTINIEGNIYFPPDSVKREFMVNSDTHTTCPWKGYCSYYDVNIAGQTNKDAAWYYHEPKAGSNEIVATQNAKPLDFSFADYVAFWHGVEVTSGQ